MPRDRPPTLELVLSDGTVFPHKGRPVFVDRAIDQKTGTIQVRAEFPNPERVLRSGQFGRVRAITEEVPDAILVPQVAVQELQGAKTVLVVGEGDKVALRTVTLREPYQQFYIVTAGLKPGERVIVEGIQKARPGMQVKAELKALTDGKPEPGRRRPPSGAPPAGESRRAEAGAVADFFIRRPIVAIVIAILTVLMGDLHAHRAQLRAVSVPGAARPSASRPTTRAPPRWRSSSRWPRRSSRRSTASTG